MAKILYGLRGYADTATNWASDATIYPLNSLLFATDTGAIKRGDGVSSYAELKLLTTATPAAWANISGKPTQIGAGATKEAARTAIGAASADHDHAVVADEDSGLAGAETIQALAIALSKRIKDLEDASEDAVSVTYTLTYTAGTNGTLTGEAIQTVEEGADGTAVTAVANAGYHFVQWSDGVTIAERTDTKVTADITVAAEFAEDASD